MLILYLLQTHVDMSLYLYLETIQFPLYNSHPLRQNNTVQTLRPVGLQPLKSEHKKKVKKKGPYRLNRANRDNKQSHDTPREPKQYI